MCRFLIGVGTSRSLKFETFLEISPSPIGRDTSEGFVSPQDSDFSGFIFKIHANLDPKHRDRIAFLRIVSGTFEPQDDTWRKWSGTD